jgi:hypothetical protein
VAASLGCIATFGITLPADAQLPGVRTDLHVPRQADRAIREGQAGGDGSAERAGGIRERTGTARVLGLGGKLNIRLRLVQALLAALFRGFANPEESIIGGILGSFFRTTHSKMLPRLFRGHISCKNAFFHCNFTCKSSE